MTPERWNRIEQLYHAALELPSGERLPWVERECGSDAELKAEVLALLESDAAADSFLDTPPGDLAAGWLARNRSRPPVPVSTGPNQNAPARTEVPTQTWGGPSPALQESVLEPRPRPIQPFVWVTVTLAVGTLVVLGWAGLVLNKFGGRSLDYGWTQTSRAEGWYVAEVNPQGPAAGKLQPGDRLLALEDDTRYGRLGRGVHQLLHPGGGSYRVRVERSERIVEYTLNATLGPANRPIWPLWILLAVGAICTACALLVGLFKPAEPLPQLVTLALFLIALTQAQNCFANVAVFLQGMDLAACRLLNAVTWFETALNFHICYRFATSVPPRRFWSGLGLLLYFWALALAAFGGWLDFGVTGISAAEKVGFYLDTLPLREMVSRYLGLYQPVGILSILAVILRNFRLVRNPDEHRRIKWLMFSVAIAAIPFLLAQTFFYVGAERWGFRLLHAGGMFVLVVPLTLVYLIRTRRLFDLTVVIRQGVKYLLARNSLRMLLFLPVLGLAASVMTNPHRTVAEILTQNPVYPVLLAVTGFSLFFQTTLLQWIDRRFFRASYDREQKLVELVEDIQRLDSMADIARLVNRTIETTLHPKRLLIFFRGFQTRDLTLGFSSDGSGRPLTLEEHSPLLRLVERMAAPVEVSTVMLEHVPQAERNWLGELEARLLFPMMNPDNHLTGLVLLGEKKSEEPYSSTDRRLLAAAIQQMGVVHEIIRLRGQVNAEEQAKRDMVTRLAEQNIAVFRECPLCGTCFDAVLTHCPTDRAELKITLPVERVVEGKYRLERLLGKGGMGAVYEATDLRLGRRVALKILINRIGNDPGILRRFEREARAAARLSHPGIVTVFDFGHISPEIAFLVMEYVAGSTLREVLKQQGKLACNEATGYLRPLLEAIQQAHEAGVVHRDLKPENILVVPSGKSGATVKILDFGLARLQPLEVDKLESLTAPGMIMGTFGYMAPEQMVGDPVDARSDIFALGVLMAEMFTGKRPFTSQTYTGLLQETLYGEYHFPTEDAVSRRLGAVIEKCLCKNPADRWQTVAVLHKELLSALAGTL
ncbi:MAG: protein kinase [Blastocatellia bacterium]|nr:protein kinase [Blastocatellia bacterium]